MRSTNNAQKLSGMLTRATFAALLALLLQPKITTQSYHTPRSPLVVIKFFSSPILYKLHTLSVSHYSFHRSNRHHHRLSAQRFGAEELPIYTPPASTDNAQEYTLCTPDPTNVVITLLWLPEHVAHPFSTKDMPALLSPLAVNSRPRAPPVLHA